MRYGVRVDEGSAIWPSHGPFVEAAAGHGIGDLLALEQNNS